MKHEVATSTSINPAYHPQPVSPLQQQRPLVGDGGKISEILGVGIGFYLCAPLSHWERGGGEGLLGTKAYCIERFRLVRHFFCL